MLDGRDGVVTTTFRITIRERNAVDDRIAGVDVNNTLVASLVGVRDRQTFNVVRKAVDRHALGNDEARIQVDRTAREAFGEGDRARQTVVVGVADSFAEGDEAVVLVDDVV